MPERAWVPGPSCRRPRVVVLALGAAIGLGLAGRIAVHAGAHLPHGDDVAALGHATVALGAPWLAVAWAVGALAGSPARAAVSGGAGLALGTFAWYALSAAAEGRAPADYATVATAWAAIALAAGALFAVAGAAYRSGGRTARTAALALVAGTLAGEALLLATQWSGRAGRVVLAAELSVALAVLALGARRTVPVLALGLGALFAIGVAGAEDAVRDALRLAGWRGR